MDISLVDTPVTGGADERKREIRVKGSHGRLDVFLKETLALSGRRLVREACARGAIRVNRAPAKPGMPLRDGDVVELTAELATPAARPDRAAAALLPQVVYEDRELLVLNKPRGIASVTLRNDDEPTLADWIAGNFSACADASPDRREAGLVQRLDFYTSGLIIAAKTSASHAAVRRELFAGEIKKEYLALVENTLVGSFTVDLPLRQSPDGKRMTVESFGMSEGSFPAVTLIETVCAVAPGAGAGPGKAAVVRAHAARARRHQIRVHLSAVGHPLAGDSLYGAGTTLQQMLKGTPDATALSDGYLLHAARLAMKHPMSGAKLKFEVPEPRFAALIAAAGIQDS